MICRHNTMHINNSLEFFPLFPFFTSSHHLVPSLRRRSMIANKSSKPREESSSKGLTRQVGKTFVIHKVRILFRSKIGFLWQVIFLFYLVEQLIYDFDETGLFYKFCYQQCYVIISLIVEDNLMVCTKNVSKVP